MKKKSIIVLMLASLPLTVSAQSGNKAKTVVSENKKNRCFQCKTKTNRTIYAKINKSLYVTTILKCVLFKQSCMHIAHTSVSAFAANVVANRIL